MTIDIIKLCKDAGMRVGTNVSDVTLVGSGTSDTVLAHLNIDEVGKLLALHRAAIIEELLGTGVEPVAWKYDWWDETEDVDGVPTGGEVNDWITVDYDEAHSPTMGCHNIRPLHTADQLAAAVLRERERCAKVCESTYSNGDGVEGWFKTIAAAIRKGEPT